MKRLFVTEIPELVRMGRTAESEDGTSLSVFWTASGIELRLGASDLFVELESIYGSLELWIDVMIDGELSQKIQLPHGRSRIPVFQGLDPSRVRTVRILRDTQAMAQDGDASVLLFHAIETDDHAMFERIPEPALRLEVIGDSITSGEGAGLERQVEWAPVVFSAVNSYGYLAAELLNAQVNILSSSGWGLYASWDANTECALPPYYHEVCGLAKGAGNEAAGAKRPWDFAAWRPDVIVINLGTNDSGAINNQNRWTREEYHPLFNNAAVSFLRDLRAQNPEARLLWAYGMLGNDMAEWIREAIADYMRETGDERVSFFAFTDCDAAHLGVRSHPNRRAHKEAAEALAEEIRRLMR
ncbi:MAG: GDSL family lipase [Lachnospiraceae bacterium]|nr:GDSL family lipase [Lachnospiraceae bacterium]